MDAFADAFRASGQNGAAVRDDDGARGRHDVRHIPEGLNMMKQHVTMHLDSYCVR